jgi:hypothetical protein
MTKFTYSAQTLSVTLCMYCLCVCTHTLPWGTHTHTNANTRSCIHVRTHPYSLSANTLRGERKSRFGSVRENHLRISFGFFLRTSSSFSLFFFNKDPNLAQNIVQPVNIGRRCGWPQAVGLQYGLGSSLCELGWAAVCVNLSARCGWPDL